MKPEDVPQELIAILDRAAGREHARTGSVVGCLAEILTRYDELRAGPGRERCELLRADVAFWRDQQKFAASVAGNLADLNDYDGRVDSLRKLLRREIERRKTAEREATVLAYNLAKATGELP